METELANSAWSCASKSRIMMSGNHLFIDCDIADLASAYDGHGFSVSNRDKVYKSLTQVQSCSVFESLNGQDLFGKVFLQFPSAHGAFETVFQLKV